MARSGAENCATFCGNAKMDFRIVHDQDPEEIYIANW